VQFPPDVEKARAGEVLQDPLAGQFEELAQRAEGRRK
jgi:hypothetical protein